VGKTALLNVLADSASASGTMVLRVAGAEFEGEISFTGLNQALLPLQDQLDELGSTHRDALRMALGLGAGPAPDRLLVSNAALALLRHAAARVPVLLIADDLPWIDRASVGVLSFVARRLAGSRAGFLVACRTGADSYFDRGGLPEYELKALDDQAAAELVRTRFPGLDPRVRSRVLDTAQGNPLALLELPQALSDAQRSAREPRPPVLPLGQRLHELFTSRVVRLPPATRALLLTAALAGTGWLGGRDELWEPFLAMMRRLTPQPPAVLALQLDTYIHPVRTGVAALPRLDAALRAVQRETDPHVIENIAACAIYADRLGRSPGTRGGRTRGRGRTGRTVLRLVLPLPTGAAGRRPGQVRHEPGARRPGHRLGRASRGRPGPGLGPPCAGAGRSGRGRLRGRASGDRPP
jgi:hypothetical protein